MKSFILVTLIILLNASLLLGIDRRRKALNIEEYQKVADAVAMGARAGLKECKNQFKWNKWNCTVTVNSDSLPIFVRSMPPYANREAAFLHAISAAGVTQSLIRRCQQSVIKGCRCSGRVCNDDYQYGARKCKQFIDALEGVEGARSALNRHNNEVGRQAVRATMKRRCRCHGPTGTCRTKTCFQRIGDMKEIGNYLKRKYRHAKKARYSTKKKLEFRTPKGYRLVRARSNPLLYMVRSPNYCERDMTLGSSGVLNRICPTNETRSAECTSLCRSCGFWPQNVIQEQTVNCHCKFFWCCWVRCKKCKILVNRIACKNKF